MYNRSRLIKRDSDGYFYIDYLGYQIAQNEDNPLRQRAAIKIYGVSGYKRKKAEAVQVNNHFFKIHKEAIEEMYTFLEFKKDSKDFDHIKEKFNWIKDYHNSFMHGERKSFFIDLDAEKIK